MSTDNPPPNNIAEQNALRRIVNAVEGYAARPAAVGARALTLAASAAVLWQISGGDMQTVTLASPVLGQVVATLGENLFANLIGQVASNDRLSDTEILKLLQESIAAQEEALDRLAATLTEREFYRAIRIIEQRADDRFETILERIEQLAETATRSGVFIQAETVNIAGDNVGGDKYETHHHYAVPPPPPAPRWEPPRVNQLHGRSAELHALATLFDEVLDDRKTSFVIVTGPYGSGRLALADDVRAYARERGATTELADLNTDPRDFGSFVRSVARREPLVLVIDCLEREHTSWLDTLMNLADELINGPESLPVLFVVTLTTSLPVEDLAGEQHSEPTRWAETLQGRSLADVLHLDPLTLADIQEVIDPADSALAQRLFQLTDGDALWVEVVWQEWQAAGFVRQDSAGVWQATEGEAAYLTVYGDVSDVARHYLEGLVLGWECDHSPFSLEEIERILNCAAMEGLTFTAEAVAGVLKLDLEALYDLFDDFLCPYEPLDDPAAHEPGVVMIVRAVRMDPYQEHRYVWEYRFTRPYFYYVWRTHPPRPQERRRWPVELGHQLHNLYYPYLDGILDKLSLLAPELAEPYQERLNRKVTLDVLRYQVNLLLVDDLSDKYAAYRLFDLGFQLLGRLATERPDLWQEGARLARQLTNLTLQWGDREFEVWAKYFHAWHLRNGGQYPPALPLARSAEELSSQYSVPKLLRAACLNNLGGLLHAQGDLAGARPYYERALAIRERALGPDHPHTATSLNNLGRLLQAQGDLAGARPYLERALAIWEKALGPDHPDTATSLNNLGGLLYAQGDLAGARPYYERALAIDEKALGPDHPDTAIDLNNLGGLLKAQGDLAGARPYYERALAIFEKALGPDHPDTAQSLNNLGTLLYAQGDLAGARPYLERALAIREEALGPDHPDTAVSYWWLATILTGEGDHVQAKHYLKRALATFTARLGPDHDYTQRVRRQLDALNAQMGKP